jgi:hypothetical protein
MPHENDRFKIKSTHFSFCDPAFTSYFTQKGIALKWRENKDLKHRFHHQVLTLPDQFKVDEDALRRWRYFFEPRISAAASNELSAPQLFRGDILQIIRGKSGTEPAEIVFDIYGSLQYDYFLQMEALLESGQRLIVSHPSNNGDGRLSSNDNNSESRNYNQSQHKGNIHVGSNSTNKTLTGEHIDDSYWPWLYCTKPVIRRLHPHTSLEMISLKPIKELVSDIKNLSPNENSNQCNQDELRKYLNLIHSAWAPGSSDISYNDDALALCCFIFAREAKPVTMLIPLLFELEMFASYSTQIRNQSIIGSGFYAERWLDVITLPGSAFRGTEECQVDRIFHELLNIRENRIAPIIINENGCVADGNHRLTAALLWNILHQVKEGDWTLNNDEFQRSIGAIYTALSSERTLISAHEALRSLGAFLRDNELKSKLTLLRPAILTNPIEQLPALPFLEYCALAVVATDFEESGAISRLDPLTYEILANEPDLALAARACYHFADHVPLPWFSVV